MNPGDLPLRFWQWHCRVAEPRSARKILRDTALGGNYRIVLDCEMTNDADLSGISKDLPGGAWFGYPAVPLPEAKRQIAWIHRLGKLFERVKALEKKLGA